jgi:drug/metabolite transporter (DMT)-like permease
MNSTTVFVIGAAVVWAVIGLASRRRFDFGSKRAPLVVYLIGVAVVWAVVLGLGWVIGGSERLNLLAMVCFGFAVGMLAMYIAMHVYKS